MTDESRGVVHWGNDTDRGNPKYLDKNLSHCHIVHHKSRRTDLGSNPGIRGERRATNRLSHGTAITDFFPLPNVLTLTGPMSVHGAGYVRQTEIQTAGPLVPKPSAFENELAIEKLKKRKSPGIDQIPAEFVKAGGKAIRCKFHKLIHSIWNEEELPDEWKQSITVPVCT